jgi:hypothetical protein
MNKVNLNDKLSLFNDYWNPRIVGELNGQQVKLAKLKGEFIWHHHETEDELFFVINGQLKIEFRDQTITINEVFLFGRSLRAFFPLLSFCSYLSKRITAAITNAVTKIIE